MTKFDNFTKKATKTEEIVHQLSSSSHCVRVLPTTILKKALPVITTDLTEIINTSLLQGVFPQAKKTTIIQPLLKKSNLDKLSVQKYRAISNRSYISEMIEEAQFQQINTFLTMASCSIFFKSGFHAHHSIETALIKLLYDICVNSDYDRTTLLILLALKCSILHCCSVHFIKLPGIL